MTGPWLGKPTVEWVNSTQSWRTGEWFDVMCGVWLLTHTMTSGKIQSGFLNPEPCKEWSESMVMNARILHWSHRWKQDQLYDTDYRMCSTWIWEKSSMNWNVVQLGPHKVAVICAVMCQRIIGRRELSWSRTWVLWGDFAELGGFLKWGYSKDGL